MGVKTSIKQLILILKGRLYQIAKKSIQHGLHPAWLNYRCVLKESVSEYFARHAQRESVAVGTCDIVHAEAIVKNSLPCNIGVRDELPGDRGWWGYSFRDVPSRRSGETSIVTLPNCCLVPYIDLEKDEFWPAILNQDARWLELREISSRSFHEDVLRSERPVHVKRATWVLERVYRNHSHWLTAHLPKFLLLKKRGGLANVLMPPERKRTAVMNDSLRMLGIDPKGFRTFDPTRPLDVDELTVLKTDRFRPELLRPVRNVLCTYNSNAARRKIYISRAKAPRRRLVNENDIWGLLRNEGFERVFMEDLSFTAQVELLQDASIVVAPHGAGLTNMMFCAPGTHIVEIADLSFPNPNFYALASAMEHNYWLVSAEGIGEAHPLERDMRVSPLAVRRVLSRLPL